jgi:hypothetical protein
MCMATNIVPIEAKCEVRCRLAATLGTGIGVKLLKYAYSSNSKFRVYYTS